MYFHCFHSAFTHEELEIVNILKHLQDVLEDSKLVLFQQPPEAGYFHIEGLHPLVWKGKEGGRVKIYVIIIS